MRYPASEKLEIIRIDEQSHLPAKRTLDQLGIARRRVAPEVRPDLRPDPLAVRIEVRRHPRPIDRPWPEQYLSFVLTMFIAFGCAFEVPIAVIVLARMGIVSIDKLREFRGYFIVLAFIIAAVITPPDVVSQLALAIPMCLLYEAGIWAAQLFIRHTKAPEETTETP